MSHIHNKMIMLSNRHSGCVGNSKCTRVRGRNDNNTLTMKIMQPNNIGITMTTIGSLIRTIQIMSNIKDHITIMSTCTNNIWSNGIASVLAKIICVVIIILRLIITIIL